MKKIEAYPILVNNHFYAGRCASCGNTYDYTRPCECRRFGPKMLTNEQTNKLKNIIKDDTAKMYEHISQTYRKTLDKLGE